MRGVRQLDTKLINDIASRVTNVRRQIHQYPELAYHEHKTSALILSYLQDIGIQAKLVYKTGVLGNLYGKNDGPTIILRSDIDALPITEATSSPFSSQNDGIMHACGHDMHIAILLGTAEYLVHNADFSGTLKFLFQPAEEENPDSGARHMIETGVLCDPPVKAAFALHVWPELMTGEVAVRNGVMMAASDRVKITIYGTSAHAAKPHLGTDAIVIAASIINELQKIISRNIDPLDSAVITFGKINGGTVANVIANQVELFGSIRSLNEQTRYKIRERIYCVAQKISDAHGGKCDIEYLMGHPATINDPELAEIVRCALQENFSPSNVISNISPAMTAEDFAYYAREIPGVLMWLGCRPILAGKDGFPGLHNNKFCPDEGCIAEGIKAFISAVYGYFDNIR